MNIERNIEIILNQNYLLTKGLENLVNFELRILVQAHDVRKYYDLMKYVLDYIVDSSSKILAEQTIAYHSWLLKFVEVRQNVMSLYEVVSDGSHFLEGADYAISIMDEQILICNLQEVTPLFPIFGQMIAVSKGILEGEAVNAVRYPSPKHMTGWWLTTDSFDGNIESLETIHYYHVAFKRPDIIKYLGLPAGFRFYLKEGVEVWFDEDVVS